MSTNLFLRLARMLPDAPVYVGRVLAHHDDDTSTVELPINLATTVVGGNVARGSLIRPRGRTVPVGGWAFVRRGVIETRAPDPAPEAVSVGAPVTPPLGPWLIDHFERDAGPLPDGGPSDSAHTWTTTNGDAELNGAGAVEGSGSFSPTRVEPSWTSPATLAFYVEAQVLVPVSAGPSYFDSFGIALLFDVGNFFGINASLGWGEFGGAPAHYTAEIYYEDDADYSIQTTTTGLTDEDYLTFRVEVLDGHTSARVLVNGTQIGSTITWTAPLPASTLLLTLRAAGGRVVTLRDITTGPLV